MQSPGLTRPALAIRYLSQLYQKLGRPEQAKAWAELYHVSYGAP